MRSAWLIGFSLLAMTVALSAQRGPARPDPRVGAGGIRVDNPNILHPGSPSGSQPGSILTPGTPRPPAASPLPATPGAAPQQRPPVRGGHGPRVYGGRRGYVPVYGYGYGGVYIDSGAGPTEVAPEQEAAASETNVITVPPREEKDPPRSRVYDVRETAEGAVEMQLIGPSEGAAAASATDYSLIALQGGLIYAVEQYQQRQGTFRFTTIEGKQFVVPLAEVDLGFTKKLNADLGKPFPRP